MQTHKFRLTPSRYRHGRHRTPQRPRNPQSEISRQNPRSANLPRRPRQGFDRRRTALNQTQPKPSHSANNVWSMNSNEARARTARSTGASVSRKAENEPRNSATAGTAPNLPDPARPAAPPAPRSTRSPAGEATPGGGRRPNSRKVHYFPAIRLTVPQYGDALCRQQHPSIPAISRQPP